MGTGREGNGGERRGGEEGSEGGLEAPFLKS